MGEVDSTQRLRITSSNNQYWHQIAVGPIYRRFELGFGFMRQAITATDPLDHLQESPPMGVNHA